MKPITSMSKLNAHEHVVVSKIYMIRGQKVVMDQDLAEMYGVDTKRLNEQVKRNLERFPKDFMFQLTSSEFANLRPQVGEEEEMLHMHLQNTECLCYLVF